MHISGNGTGFTHAARRLQHTFSEERKKVDDKIDDFFNAILEEDASQDEGESPE